MKYTYSHNNLIIRYKGKDKKGIPLIRTEELHIFYTQNGCHMHTNVSTTVLVMMELHKYKCQYRGNMSRFKLH